jgi:hypothetical protein
MPRRNTAKTGSNLMVSKAEPVAPVSIQLIYIIMTPRVCARTVVYSFLLINICFNNSLPNTVMAAIKTD